MLQFRLIILKDLEYLELGFEYVSLNPKKKGLDYQVQDMTETPHSPYPDIVNDHLQTFKKALETAVIIRCVVRNEDAAANIDLPVYNNIRKAGCNILTVMNTLLLSQSK